MHLTRFTDLGIRTMMLLASGESDDRRVTTRTIAVSAGASDNHIAKAVSRLSNSASCKPGVAGSAASR